ncbi:MAG: hypothetical protein EA351_13780 [Gemmatimonadales bacterium]|nr:MAG: hypothetical protein EA351_13780 [Gemmatimonadales bacterium]
MSRQAIRVRPPHFLIPVALVLAVGLLAGCSEGSSELIAIEGTYTLESVNGMSLPAVFEESEDGTREALEGQLVLNDDATCEQITEVRATLDDMIQTETVIEPCLWSGNPEALEVVWEDERIYLGALLGDELTLSGNSGVWVYIR